MIAMLLGTGFEPLEAVAPCDVLRRSGEDVKLVSLGKRLVEAGHGVRVEADCTLEEIDATALKMIILPGGLGGVHSILGCEKALELVKKVYAVGGFVAAICAGPTILAKLGLLEGVKATCYPGCEADMAGAVMQDAGVVRDGKVITGRAAGSATEFGLALVEALQGEQAAQKIAGQIVYHH